MENSKGCTETHCLLAFSVSVEKFDIQVFKENKLYILEMYIRSN